MHILINITTCGTLVGQSLTKTAFGVTLLRMTKNWLRWVVWFCIGTMNLWMILKAIFQWAKVCNEKSYQNSYRLDFCIGADFRDDFKEGGNSTFRYLKAMMMTTCWHFLIVYNIIMDFVFAFIPWLVLKPLDMKRVEKIGLGVTMSLGMTWDLCDIQWSERETDRAIKCCYCSSRSCGLEGWRQWKGWVVYM